MDRVRMKALLLRLWEEAEDLVQLVSTNQAAPAELVALADFVDDQFTRHGYVKPHQYQMPEAPSGHGGKVVLLALNPSDNPLEDCPRFGSHIDTWMGYYQCRFERAIGVYNHNGMKIASIPLYDKYQRLLQLAFGEGARLGVDGLVLDLIPYKAHGDFLETTRGRMAAREAANRCLLPTLSMLSALEPEVIVTFGDVASKALATTAGVVLPSITQANGQLFRHTVFSYEDVTVKAHWIPAIHPASFGYTNAYLNAVGKALVQALPSVSDPATD